MSESGSAAELTRAATHGVRWISVSRIATEILLFGSMVVLAHLIPPAAFGQFAIAVIVQELAMSLPTEGVGSALVQRKHVDKEHLQAGQFIAIVSGFALAGLTLLLSTYVIGPIFGPETADLSRLSAVMFPLAATGAAPIAVLRRRLDFRALSIMEVSASITRAIVSVGLAAVVGLEGSALVWGALAATTAATLVAFAHARPPFPWPRPRAARDIAEYGGFASMASFAWIGFRNGDYAVVAARLGSTAAGIYWRAFQLAVEYQRKISVVMYSVAFPILSRSTDPDEMFALRRRMVRLMTVVIFPLLAGLSATAPVIIPFVFGHNWDSAVVPTQILCGAGAATLVIDAVGTTLMATGRPRALFGYGVAHFVTYVGTVVLVSPLGLSAVAIAAVTVHTLFLLVAYMLLVPRQPVAAARCLWDDAGPATASSLFLVAAAVGVAVVASAVHLAGAVHVVVLLIVCPPVYLVALRTLFRESWDDLIRLARRMLPTPLARRMTAPAPAPAPAPAMAMANPAIDTGGPEMTTDSAAEPTVSVVVAAYNSEQWIVETITAILDQTRRPDEVIVVDDGSTDGTVALLSGFGDQIQVVRRINGGCPAAFNTAFAAATCDFVAMCGSDDVWKPHKLERQIAMLAEHPEIDVAFSDAELFGLASGTYAKPPGTGILDSAKLARALYVENIICAPSIVIRRSMFERLGPFIEDFGADDLEYWLRCLRAGAVFAFDPEVLLGYRRHESNLSSRLLWMQQCTHEVHRLYAEDMGHPRFVSSMLSSDLFKIGRSLVDDGRIGEARAAFRASRRHRIHARALAWSALLTLPPTAQETLADSLIGARRRLRKVGFSRTAS